MDDRSPETADELADALVAIGNQDRDALDQLIANCGGQLFALCLRITGNRSAAEDVFQECMIKVWNRAAAFQPGRSSAMAWLATIARNSAIDWHRANARRLPLHDDSLPEIKDEKEPVLDRMLRLEREAQALQLLSELPDEHETEVRGIYLEGLTYLELADRHSIPLPTLKSRVRRSLIALRKKMHDD